MDTGVQLICQMCIHCLRVDLRVVSSCTGCVQGLSVDTGVPTSVFDRVIVYEIGQKLPACGPGGISQNGYAISKLAQFLVFTEFHTFYCVKNASSNSSVRHASIA